MICNNKKRSQVPPAPIHHPTIRILLPRSTLDAPAAQPKIIKHALATVAGLSVDHPRRAGSTLARVVEGEALNALAFLGLGVVELVEPGPAVEAQSAGLVADQVGLALALGAGVRVGLEYLALGRAQVGE